MITYGGKPYPKKDKKNWSFSSLFFCFHSIIHMHSFKYLHLHCLFLLLSFDLLHNSCVQSFDFSWFYWWIWPIPTLPYQWEIISSPPKAHVPVSTNLSSCHRMCKCPSVFHMQQQAHVDIHVSFVLYYKHIRSTLWDGNMINKCSLKGI